jgi:hypothetical protein
MSKNYDVFKTISISVTKNVTLMEIVLDTKYVEFLYIYTGAIYFEMRQKSMSICM